MLKWTARVTALLLALLVIVIFMGEFASEGFRGFSLRESLMMLAFFAVWLGYLIGWKMQKTGGLMVLAGIAAFYLLDYGFSGSFPRGPVFPLMGIPGVLYILSSLKRVQQV